MTPKQEKLFNEFENKFKGYLITFEDYEEIFNWFLKHIHELMEEDQEVEELKEKVELLKRWGQKVEKIKDAEIESLKNEILLIKQKQKNNTDQKNID